MTTNGQCKHSHSLQNSSLTGFYFSGISKEAPITTQNLDKSLFFNKEIDEFNFSISTLLSIFLAKLYLNMNNN